jgi:hypothetical protein
MQLGKNVPKKKINEISCFEWGCSLLKGKMFLIELEVLHRGQEKMYGMFVHFFSSKF